MKPGLFSISAGRLRPSYDKALAKIERVEAMRRIMTRDASAYGGTEILHEKITNRLGWVDIAGKMRRKAAEIEAFGQSVLQDGLRHVVLLGMGGSSLCPDLFGRVFGTRAGIETFTVLDSTDPSAVKAARQRIALDRTLFIVSSKSGGTVETRSQMMYFLGQLANAGIERPGSHFVAITDKGSSLATTGKQEKFRKVFINPSDIGGRYSALSYFGLVPAWFAGVGLKGLLDDAFTMEKLVRERTDETNPASALAALMATAAGEGMNKLTFVASGKIAPLIPWIEQLVAESTGKKGKGVVPIEGEPLGAISEYGPDRVFVTIRMDSEKSPLPNDLRGALQKKNTPIVEITLNSLDQLGGQFVLWEAATAAAGWLMGINPFDEPNVTESKQNTEKILDGYRESGQFADLTPSASYNSLALLSHGGRKKYKLSEISDLKQLLAKFLGGLKGPQYLSVLCYLKEEPQIDKALSQVRTAIRRKHKTATLRGYGPRYLHSIGQLYKGGPEEGRFIVFVRSDYESLEIPGRFYDFGQLITAQAIGDARALLSRNLPILVFAVKGNAIKGVKEFADVIDAVCQ